MQVQNNKEEVPFAHYEEKFAALLSGNHRNVEYELPVHRDAARHEL